MRSRSTRLAALAWVCLAPHAWGQEPSPAELARVEVTGSRLRQIDSETPLPVTVISREQIDRSGATTAQDVLARLSASAHTDKEIVNGGRSDMPGYAGVAIRGFGGAGTLILLDGRRLANFPFAGGGSPGVDLNAIPLAAIERIEILKDGASAIYGSDALGGVINFILRKDFRGDILDLGAGAATHGGAGTRHATATFGRGSPLGDGYNVLTTLDVQHQDALSARDRPFAANGFRPEVGLDGTSPSSFPANIKGPRGLVNPVAPGCTAQTVNVGAACLIDSTPFFSIVPKTDTIDLLSSGVLKTSPTSEAYAQFAWSRHRFESSISPQAVNPTTLGSGPLRLPATSPYYPGALGLAGSLDIRYRALPLGPLINRVDTDQGRLVIGWRGDVAGWDIDVALAHARAVAANRYRSGYLDAQRIVDAFASGQVNPFGDSGPFGDSLLDTSEAKGVSRRGASTDDVIDMRLRRDLAQWRSGPVGLSIGAEARRDSMADSATELANEVVGAANGSDYATSTTGRRRSQAVYVELALPVAANLETLLALRTDRFNDFGTTTTPKVALSWRAQPWLLVRGSIGRGFRAPSLSELYTAQQANVVTTGLSDPIRCPATASPSDCSVETTVVSGGNPALKPMRTRQQTIGIVLEPARDAALGIEAWRVRTTNFIAGTALDEALSGLPAYEQTVVVRQPPDPASPGLPGPITRLLLMNQNIGRIDASGIDVNAKWSHELACAKVTLTLNGEYNTKVYGQFDGLSFSSILGVSSVGGLVVPRWEHRATVSVESGSWTTTLSNRLRGSYIDVPAQGFDDRRVSSDLLWNGQLAYRVWQGSAASADIVLGVNNVFDRAPPFTRLVDIGFDPRNGDPRGRFGYLNVRLSHR